MSAVRALLDFLLPPGCAGCGTPLPEGSRGRRSCPRCRTRLRPIPHPRCERCHAPRGTGLPAERPCPECEDWPTILRGARAAAVLAPPADAFVHGLKYGGWEALAGEMAERMVRRDVLPEEFGPGTPVVPVPTTRERERERGYNQAERLAAEVARQGGFSLVNALFRKGSGGSQVALHPDERKANVHGAFSPLPGMREWIAGKHVLLVDDVLTTSATAQAAAEALEAGGAGGVTLLVFARALPGHDGRDA